MRIRNGFVTNSSSTNFIFMFSGNEKNDLFNLIRNSKEKFDIKYYDYDNRCLKCNAEDIIKCIIECLDKTDYLKVKIYTKEEYMEILDKRIGYWKESYKDKYRKKAPEDSIKIEDALKEANLDDIDSVLEIQFGDNHGNICMNDIGITMDYEGRYLHIINKDFIVLTEQNR